jgi:hypothetical protein
MSPHLFDAVEHAEPLQQFIAKADGHPLKQAAQSVLAPPGLERRQQFPHALATTLATTGVHSKGLQPIERHWPLDTGTFDVAIHTLQRNFAKAL